MRRRDRCVQLAGIAGGPVSLVTSITLGLPPATWLLLCAVVLALVAAAVLLATHVSGAVARFRSERSRTRPRWLAVLAALLPDLWAASWAEEMHDQLLASRGSTRRRLLWNMVTRAPSGWAVTWRVHSQHTRRLRYRGDELFLAARLDAALRPPTAASDPPTRSTALQAVGMSPALLHRPVRELPTLALARQLLSTKDPDLEAARTHVRGLLALREQAQLVACRGDIRSARPHGRICARRGDESRVDKLQLAVQQQVLLLKRELQRFIARADL